MTADEARRLKRTLAERLKAGVQAGVFPGASASVALFRQGVWRFTDETCGRIVDRGAEVTVDTVYDLASLTKPCVAMAALRLHERGAFALDAAVEELVPESRGHPIGARTWESVLSHRAGLPAWIPFYETLDGPGSPAAEGSILASIVTRPLTDEGTAVYSDLGYILAGIAIRRAVGASLDRIVADEITAPLDLEDFLFFGAARPNDAWKSRCAPSGWSAWRGRDLRGEVHDDNCAALGGVAGHAGLFGTAPSVARFGAACVSAWHGRRGASEEAIIRHATAPRSGGSHRLGWDGKAARGSAAGSRIGDEAFGHLGFTGTSIWCDPERELVVVLLTNRVAVSSDNAAIRAYRPVFHDVVIDALEGNQL